MMDVLRIYRNQVESGIRELPSSGEARNKLLVALRTDLGLQ